MRIAVISTMDGFPWGGSEELWAAMVIEALNGGHDVAASVYQWPSIPSKVLELQQKGAQILNRPRPGFRKLYKGISKSISLFRNSLCFSPVATYLFSDLFSWNPDVICISQGGTYDTTVMPELLNTLYRASIPYVVVCQFNNDAQILNGAAQGAATKFFEHAFRVIFVSHHNMRVAERQLARSLPNALVLQNPVNLSDLTTVPWPSLEPVRMASIARLEAAYKGQDVLFEALISPVWRSRKWQLSLCGDGPDRNYLKMLAKHYGIADYVQFLGHVKDLRTIWSNNHLLVLPSRSEGTPLSLVEAMVCGRPSVVTDVGGNAEWIKEHKTGFIAEAPTAKSFGAALEKAWQAQASWKEMGIKAHESAMIRLDHSPGKNLLKVVLDAVHF